MTLDEKLEISNKVLVELLKHKDVAKEYRVSAARVSQLICRIKKQPKMLELLVEKKDERRR